MHIMHHRLFVRVVLLNFVLNCWQAVLGGSRFEPLVELPDKRLFVYKDPILSLEEEVRASVLPSTVPLGPTFGIHWLSVQGSQVSTRLPCVHALFVCVCEFVYVYACVIL